MKRMLLFLCMFMSFSVVSTWAGDETGKNVEIEKGEVKNEITTLPRIPYEVPITCTYSNASLFFTFLEDLGEVEIKVTHQATGANATYRYDSVWGSVVVPASSESGSYLIEIVTESGEYYYGEYEL